MFGAKRDVNGLIFGHQLNSVVNRHPCRTGHHDPVFRSVMVALQRQRRPRLDHNAFHLKAVGQRQRLKPTPRPMVTRKGFCLGRLVGLQTLDGDLDILRPAFVGDQHGVGHGDGDQVVQTDPHQFQPVRP